MALDWLPTYPDRLRRAGGLGGAARTAFAANLDPIANPTPPTELTWLPHYVDRTPTARRLLAPPSTFQWPMVPIANTEWAPGFPSRLFRRRLPVADMPAWFGVLGTQQVIAQQMFWQATYPSRLRRATTVPPSQSVYPIQGSTIIAAAGCVEWSEVDLERPTIDGESMVRPSMTCDVHEVVYLLLEDGGFLLWEDGGKIELEDQTACTQEVFVRPILDEESVC